MALLLRLARNEGRSDATAKLPDAMWVLKREGERYYGRGAADNN